jgi:hypothetical protein
LAAFIVLVCAKSKATEIMPMKQHVSGGAFSYQRAALG